MSFIEDGFYAQTRTAEADDPNADDAAAPATLATLRGCFEPGSSTSAGRAGGDPRNIRSDRLRLDPGADVRPDDRFTKTGGGPTYVVTAVNQEADWLFPGDLLLDVRLVG